MYGRTVNKDVGSRWTKNKNLACKLHFYHFKWNMWN
jgi:hypothetical protein